MVQGQISLIMLQKWYELTCDYCGTCINHYIGRKPSREELTADGVITTSSKHFCSDICRGEFQHDLDEKKYCNLKQNGKFHPNY